MKTALNLISIKCTFYSWKANQRFCYCGVSKYLKKKLSAKSISFLTCGVQSVETNFMPYLYLMTKQQSSILSFLLLRTISADPDVAWRSGLGFSLVLALIRLLKIIQHVNLYASHLKTWSLLLEQSLAILQWNLVLKYLLNLAKPFIWTLILFLGTVSIRLKTNRH